jgi:hypothetical protein
MSNYYLKADSETALWEALEAAGLAVKDYDPTDVLNVRPEDELNHRPDDLDPETEWQPTGAFDWRFTGQALDIIGVIYKPTGTMLTDEEGFEYPEMAAIDGYHANLIAEAGLDLPTIEAPATPYRVWAGA